MSDFTLHKDPERKARYIARHQAHEHWEDPRSAGFWSRWLLWNKPSLRASAQDIKRRFGIVVTFGPSLKGSRKERGGSRASSPRPPKSSSAHKR